MRLRVLSLLLRWFALRHARDSLRASALLVAVLALGVSVFVAIRLANRAAVESFRSFADGLAGQSDFSVRAKAGALPEGDLAEVRRALGHQPVDLVPVLEAVSARPAGSGASPQIGSLTYQVLGVDLLGLGNLPAAADLPSRYLRQAAGDNSAPNRFWEDLAGPPQVWVSPAVHPLPTALDLVFGEQVHRIPVAGPIPTLPDSPAPPATLLVMSLDRLQELTGRKGQLDRIDVLLEAGPDPDRRRAEVGAALRSSGRWIVDSSESRRKTGAAMTEAFRFNLTVLSLIALLVGLYLIFEALDGAVVRRRTEIAVLRSLGVTVGDIRLAWLVESALLGLLGGAVGIVGGWAAAQLAVRAVGRTVDALYFSTSIATAGLTPGEAALGLALGITASLVAGWWPAHIAARVPPAQTLPRSSAPPRGRPWPADLGLAAGLVALGVVLARLPPWRSDPVSRLPIGGFGAALCWIVGGGLACGWLLPVVGRGLRRIGPRSAPVVVALGQLRRAAGRQRLAVAALHCAFGMAAGMAILVASFEHSVVAWIDQILKADLYLTSEAGTNTTAHAFLSLDAVRQIQTLPGVLKVEPVTVIPVNLAAGSTQLTGTDLGEAARDCAWVEAPTSRLTSNGVAAFASEAFCERFNAGVGATVLLPTPTGVQPLRIVGVFADYGNERGSLMVERDNVMRWFQEPRPTHLSVWLRPGTDLLAARDELHRRFPGLAVYTNATLREEVLRVFRQTFGITYALEVIGIFVSLAGLALALASAILDRRDELTVLRTLGFRRGELASAAAVEAVAVAGAAVTGGFALSVALGWLLIHVINKQSFGWTLGFRIPWGQLAALALAIVVLAAAVGGAVGRIGAGLAVDREE